MRKLFSLLTAILFAGSLMATDYELMLTMDLAAASQSGGSTAEITTNAALLTFLQNSVTTSTNIKTASKTSGKVYAGKGSGGDGIPDYVLKIGTASAAAAMSFTIADALENVAKVELTGYGWKTSTSVSVNSSTGQKPTTAASEVTFSYVLGTASKTISISVSSSAFCATQIKLYKVAAASCSNEITITKADDPDHGTFVLNTSGKVCIDGGNASTTVTATPDEGYRLASVTSTVGAVGDIDGNTCAITGINANTTVSVAFEAIPKYTVSFSTGEGNPEVAAKTETLGGQGIELPEGPAPTCTDWTFAGWKETSAVAEQTATAPTLLTAGDNFKPAANCTLYAVYSKEISGSGTMDKTASVTISEYATAKSWGSSSSDGQKSIAINSDVTATASSGTNTGKYYSDWRFYQGENATLTIETTSGTLKSATFTYSVSNTGALFDGETQLTSGTEYPSTGSLGGTSHEFTVGNSGSANNGQVRFTAISVKYTVAASTTYYTSAPSCAAPGQCETPEFSPSAGTYYEAKEVVISCSTTDAAIYYTTDGTTPSDASTLYTGAITVDQSMTIKAIAIKDGLTDSEVAEAEYVLQCATPTIVKAETHFIDKATITLACESDGAAIYYTLNGDDPTASSTLYSEPFTINDTKTIKAIAIKTGWTNSEIASANFKKALVLGVSGALTTIAELSDGGKTLDSIYVQGYVKEITEVNTGYKNATYILKDAGIDNELTIFRGRNVGNTDFTDASQIAVGDKVIIKGILQKYVKNEVTTPQATQGNYIVERVEKGNVASLEVDGTPTKTEYYYNETLDPTGLTVLAVYDNGYKAEVASSDVEWSFSPEKITASGYVTAYATYATKSNYKVVSVTMLKADAELAWSAATATAYTVGKSYTLPTLSNPNSLTVAYSSSNTDAATINAETGAITLKATGATTITATFAGNETYAAKAVSYTLNVYAPTVVVTGTPKTAYEYNEYFSFDNLGAKAVYGDETEYEIPDGGLAGWTANPMSVTADGQVQVYVTYATIQSQVRTFDVTVNKHAVTFAAPANGTLAVKRYNGNGWVAINSGDEFVKGTTLKVEATPASADYELASLTVNGEDFTSGETYEVGTANIEVAAAFNLKPAAPISWESTEDDVREFGKSYEATSWRTLNNNGFSITVTSSNTAVIPSMQPYAGSTVTSIWYPTSIDGTGTTVITATSEATDSYRQTSVSYNIVVKAASGLAWSAESADVRYGASNTYPTLTNTHSLAVTYSSSNTDIATISNEAGHEGEITLKAHGSTTITASFAGDETYAPKEVSYTLNVSAGIVTVTPDPVALDLGEVLYGDVAANYGKSFHLHIENLSANKEVAIIMNHNYCYPASKWVTADGNGVIDADVTMLPITNLAPRENLYVDNIEVRCTGTREFADIVVGTASFVSVQAYAITATAENGTLTFNGAAAPALAKEGATFTLAATPDAGYTGGTITVLKAENDEDITSAVLAGNVLTMPAYAIKVSAAFTFVKLDPELSWSGVDGNNRAWAYTQGKAFDFPTLNNPNSLDVTYSCADGAGIINLNTTTGAIELLSEGAVHITATSAATATYLAGTATYTLYVCGVTTITLSGDADKKVYEYGDAFDRTGLTVTATYNNGGGTSDVTELVAWTYDKETITAGGSVHVTVNYANQTDDKYVYDVKVATHAVTWTSPAHGSLEVLDNTSNPFASGTKFRKGIEITVVPTAGSGYKLTKITLNGETLEPVLGVYSFEIDTEDVELAAIFDIATGIDNTDAEVKAVKFIENNQIFIRRGDKTFNAQGQLVK